MGILRVALALAVLLSHLPSAPGHFLGGGLAVQCFFIISGFYMALVLREKYQSLRLFYTNRLLRLLPTYFVMMALAAVALFGLKASATATPEMFAHALAQRTLTPLFSNLTLLGQELLFWFRIGPGGALQFDPSGAPPTEQSPIAWQLLLVPQAWSLSMELMFYALAPFLARLSWKPLAALAAASLALRLAGHWLRVDYGLWQGRFFPTALFLFLLGMLAHSALPLVRRLPTWLGWGLWIGVMALVVAQPLLGLGNEPGRWLVYVAMTVATPFLFQVFKNYSIDRWIGDLSYPIYLGHLMVIGIVMSRAPKALLFWALGGTFALALALLFLLEHPIDRWRQARAQRGLSGARPSP